MWPASLALRPLCLLSGLCARGLLRLFRLKPGPETEGVSEDEIRAMVDMGGAQGAIEEAEKEMIDNVFEFNNLDAGDIMVHRTDMVVLWEEDAPEEILKTIRDSGLSRFPVCREDVDDIIGVLSTRDYLLQNRGTAPKALGDLLREAYFVPESVRCDALLRDMQRKKTHMAIVVDEYGGTSGLLTMEDLLEQLVGEIYDEFDAEDEQEIIPLPDGVFRVSGAATLEAVGEALGLDIPEDEEYETLGGLIFSGLTVIPDDGSHPVVERLGLRITVEALQDRRVEWARVEKITDSEQS
jgi:putative hemolysin